MRNAHDQALATIVKATTMFPNYAEAQAMLGNMLQYDKERHAEAINALRAAIKLKPTLRQPYTDLGNILMDGDHWVIDGRQQRALVYFRKALQLKPDFARAQYGIVKAYIQGVGPKDETKTLERELAKLRKLDPKLGAEMDQYRKTYVSGLIGTEIKTDQ